MNFFLKLALAVTVHVVWAKHKGIRHPQKPKAEREMAGTGNCGGGNVGNGVCADGTCCSRFGWCGTTPDHCNSGGFQGTIGGVKAGSNSRMVAYLPNWIACPSADQLSQYTHIVIAFATSIAVNNSPNKNVCSSTCDIKTPDICSNGPNSQLISALKKAGKKVIVSFGGATMGGSWASSQDDCWEYCFDKVDHVVDQLLQITQELNLDGVDIDYEYFHEDGQNGSSFSRGAEAQNFLEKVTLGLRSKLPSGSLVTHAPMDGDIVPGRGYFNVLSKISSSLDFIMPQYYNGIVQPIADGFEGTGVGSMSASTHVSRLVNTLFGGDATRVVFGFCLQGCIGRSNANSVQASTVMTALAKKYRCNGGAFFWSSEYDSNGIWSSAVNKVVQANSANCGNGGPLKPPTSQPNRKPPTQGTGTCGGGSVGNGICADGTCCSKWGWCGTTPDHCSNTNPSPPTPQPIRKPPTPPTQGTGTCGRGSVGNGICADGTCCSQWGWCGTTSAHCTGVPTPPTTPRPPSPPTTSGSTGTCGGGNRGDGKCANGECCSQWGWCGTSAEHCKASSDLLPAVPMSMDGLTVRAAGTCGGGDRGNGVCSNGECCSQWGWCGTSQDHCSGSTPTTPTTPSPPTPASTGTCGGGNRGDGKCASGECCSKWGWCGTSQDHCSGSPTAAPTSGTTGTCGGGNRGNGKCRNGECCSQWGWCGTTPEHCNGSPPTAPTSPTPNSGSNRFKTLNFLNSISNKKDTAVGIHNKYISTPKSFTDQVTAVAGKTPALWSSDFHFDAESLANRWTMVQEAKRQWDSGALISILWHACNPAMSEPCWWNSGCNGDGPWSGQRFTDAQFNELVTDGTNLNRRWKQMMDDVAKYLQWLKDNGVEVMFRPLHEMNQGCFWWGGRPGPNGTAKLYRITRDYFTNIKKLDNLVWVWDLQDFGSLSTDVVAYNPGNQYWDVAALDIYDGYSRNKYDIMVNAAGGKPIAIGECDVLPTSSRLADEYKWTFFMSWSELTFQKNSNSQIWSVYNSAEGITLDEMPAGWNK